MPRTSDAEFFLKTLRELGGSAGNKALRQRLGSAWTDEQKYFAVRKRLIDEGVVDTGRGKGGSVYIIGDGIGEEGGEDEHLQAEPNEELKAEKDYYPYVLAKLHEWLSHDFDNVVIDITAFPGRKPLVGKWYFQDILALTFQKFDYVAYDEFILRSYEIKRSDVADTDAVAEAAAHKRIVDSAYLVIIQHGESVDIFDPTNDRRRSIERECFKAGIGLILLSKSEDGWVELAIEATATNLNYRDINSTIGRLFSAPKREEIRKIVSLKRNETARSLATVLAENILGIEKEGENIKIVTFIDAFENIVRRHNEGVLTDEEFEKAKKDLLNM
jgi:hypothetical protein